MYNYNRTAMASSYFARLLDNHTQTLQKELLEKTQKYCGSESKCQAKVEVANGYLNVSVWLDLGTDSNQDEAEELAKILLGRDVVVRPHLLVPGLWIASIKARLG